MSYNNQSERYLKILEKQKSGALTIMATTSFGPSDVSTGSERPTLAGNRQVWHPGWGSRKKSAFDNHRHQEL
jgi:hypothetical protein